jgi:hypothetical protein
MDQFNDRPGWDLMIESRQYRNFSAVRRMDLRSVADFAFLDLITLYILYNEYEMAAVAARYADKTISFRNFGKTKLNGTDLYISLNILADPIGIFSKKIEQNPEADDILRAKISVNLPTIKRYLDLIADNKITNLDAAQLLLRIERQLNIMDPQLKAIRRLAQEWPNITLMQRSLVVTRMLQFYRKKTNRSELLVFLEDIGRIKGYELRGPVDAELANLGMGPSLFNAIAPLAGLGLGTVGAYKLGKMLTAPEEDK